MTKAEMLADPNSCWNRAKDDEPVFVLLGRDPEAPGTVDYWSRKRRERKGKAADADCLDAFYVSGSMIRYRRKQEKKTEQPTVIESIFTATIRTYINGQLVPVKVVERVQKTFGLPVAIGVQEVRRLECHPDMEFVVDFPPVGKTFAVYSDELKGNFIVTSTVPPTFKSNGEYELTPNKEATYGRSDPRD